MKAVSAQVISCCVLTNRNNIIQKIHDNIPFIFECWADPVVHLLLLKSSMYKFIYAQGRINKCSLVEGGEGSCLSNCHTNLDIVREELFLFIDIS